MPQFPADEENRAVCGICSTLAHGGLRWTVARNAGLERTTLCSSYSAPLGILTWNRFRESLNCATASSPSSLLPRAQKMPFTLTGVTPVVAALVTTFEEARPTTTYATRKMQDRYRNPFQCLSVCAPTLSSRSPMATCATALDCALVLKRTAVRTLFLGTRCHPRIAMCDLKQGYNSASRPTYETQATDRPRRNWMHHTRSECVWPDTIVHEWTGWSQNL
jgi:hypothetical protein